MNDLLAWARAEGYCPVMVSQTFRHKNGDDLAQQLDRLKQAKQRWARHRAFANFRPALVGSVTATEVTGGGKNGWHPHFHQIMIVRADSEADAIAQVQALGDAWRVSLAAEGLDGNEAAFHVQGAKAAGRYITKWGAAEELALGGYKSGRSGRAPFQLLAAATDDNDERAGRLFAEFSRVFKGRRQLVWSRGLRDLAGIGEVSDEQAAEDAVRKAEADKSDEQLRNYTPSEWRKVRPHRSTILRFAELAGVQGVAVVERLVLTPLPSPAAGGYGGRDPHVRERSDRSQQPPHVTNDRRGAPPSHSTAVHPRPDKQVFA